MFNYTSIFPSQSPLIQNNSIYKCCTILNGIIQQCQQFLAYTELNTTQPLTTPTPLTNSKTKTKLITSTLPLTTTSTSNSSTTSTTTTNTVSSSNLTTAEFKLSQIYIEKGIKIIEKNENKQQLLAVRMSSTTISINSQTNNISSTITIQNEMSDAEIGIIIACTGGIIVIAFIFVLGMLCYKRHRYGANYLSKSTIG